MLWCNISLELDFDPQFRMDWRMHSMGWPDVDFRTEGDYFVESYLQGQWQRWDSTRDDEMEVWDIAQRAGWTEGQVWDHL